MLDPDPNVTLSDFQKLLPEDLRSDPAFAEVKDVPGLAKSYLEASKKAGSALAVPPEDATPEKLEEFYKSLGRPGKAEEYVIPDLKLPAGVEMNDAIKKDLADLRQLSFQLGHTPRQARAFAAWYEQKLANEHKEAMTTAEKGLETLKGEWGAKYDEKVGLTNRFVLQTGGQEVLDVLGAAGLTLHPTIIKFLEKVSAPFLEDSTAEGERRGLRSADEEARMKKLYPSMS